MSQEKTLLKPFTKTCYKHSLGGGGVNAKRNKAMLKSKVKYICRYCRKRHNAKWIKRMNNLYLLEIRHLKCINCGNRSIIVEDR